VLHTSQHMLNALISLNCSLAVCHCYF